MNNHPENYITAQQAASLIKNGDRVVIGHACGEPLAITRAFAQRIPQLENVETVHMIGMGESLHCAPQAQGHVRHNSIFVGAKERTAVAENRADFTPCYFSRIPSLFRDGALPPDVALVQVSPPDKHGYVSFGVSVDYTMEAVKNAKLKIAQVNRFMPRCHGDCFMHVSAFEYLVPGDIPLPELKSGGLGDVERAIGRNCADLICDGATLQLGIGTLPDAVLQCLKDKQDLGIHSEMFSDGVVDLVRAGVVNNSKKTLHPGKMVATFLMGTQKLYDFVNDNPAVYMASAEYTNNPYVIAQNSNMVSLNSCVQVDLTGQVCSESVGFRQISSVGGQVDFVRGAAMAQNGISIIAMPSTAKNGTVSKIVPVLDHGAAVTTGRNDVMYICSEYGCVNLQGKTLRERAAALIGIAHPAFREGLERSFYERFDRKDTVFLQAR